MDISSPIQCIENVRVQATSSINLLTFPSMSGMIILIIVPNPYSNAKLATDVVQCLKLLEGEGQDEVLTSIEMPQTKFSCKKKIDVSRSSLRRLRVHWMYENKTFLWLNDEV